MPREAGRAASRVLRHVRGRRGAEVAQHAQHEVAEDAPSGTPPILPCLARLYANTSLDKPLTRNLRADLELLRRSNTSLLGLEGRIIHTHIVRIDKRYALVDTGFKKLARFDRRSLRPSQLLKEAEGGEPRKPGEFRAGDQLEFKVTDIESAFGDMQISSNILPDGDRFETLWEELEQIQAARKQVMGRMLNTITGGYAVGIAGIVAFLPFSSCSLVSAGRIGTLQAFYINQLKKDKRNIILVDARIAESSSYRGRAGEPTFGRGSRFASLY